MATTCSTPLRGVFVVVELVASFMHWTLVAGHPVGSVLCVHHLCPRRGSRLLPVLSLCSQSRKPALCTVHRSKRARADCARVGCNEISDADGRACPRPIRLTLNSS